MARPINPNPPIRDGYVRQKRWDGLYYVMERSRQYDHGMGSYKNLKSVAIGVLLHKSDPIESMIPIDVWKKRREEERYARKKAKEQEKEQAARERMQKREREHRAKDKDRKSIPAPEIVDSRALERVVFPAQNLFLIAMGAFASGYDSCEQAVAYYNTRKSEFAKTFKDFPLTEMARDTMHRFVSVLGKNENMGLFRAFNEMILDDAEEAGLKVAQANMTEEEQVLAETRTIALDGQAVRATRRYAGSQNSRGVISFLDCSDRVVLEHAVIDAKTNEIPHAMELIEKIDRVRGAVIIADALHTHPRFAKKICSLGADYVLPVKGNEKGSESNIKELFEKRAEQCEVVKGADTLDFGHGRIEQRFIRILPGHMLDEDIQKKWVMISDGCVAELKTIFTNKVTNRVTNDTRYFISSLNFDKKYIAKQIMRVIRDHWSIENRLHWVLDVVYNQDRTQCRNNEFFTGKMTLMKMAYNFVQEVRKIEINETGKEPTLPALKAKFSDFKYFHKMYLRVLGKKAE